MVAVIPALSLRVIYSNDSKRRSARASLVVSFGMAMETEPFLFKEADTAAEEATELLFLEHPDRLRNADDTSASVKRIETVLFRMFVSLSFIPLQPGMPYPVRQSDR